MEPAQLQNRINVLEKNKIDVDSLKEGYKELLNIIIKKLNSKLILKAQQRFTIEKHH